MVAYPKYSAHSSFWCRLQVLSETLEKKEAQLGEVLTASNLDPGTLADVTNKLDDVLESKNQLIKALQYDLAKVSKVGGGTPSLFTVGYDSFRSDLGKARLEDFIFLARLSYVCEC